MYWSHLEEDERFRYLSAEMKYRPRPVLLGQTSAYTGFSCFPQGYRESCRAGGLWDRQLGAAVEAGTCHRPWVIGEADYQSGDRDEQYRNICDPTTIFSLVSPEADDVFRALAQGRMYAYAGRRFSQSLLEVFRVTDAATGGVGRMAEEIAEAMRTIILDHELRTALSVMGRLRARQFSWDCVGRQTIETYESVRG